jgi:hypothetical protein
MCRRDTTSRNLERSRTYRLLHHTPSRPPSRSALHARQASSGSARLPRQLLQFERFQSTRTHLPPQLLPLLLLALEALLLARVLLRLLAFVEAGQELSSTRLHGQLQACRQTDKRKQTAHLRASSSKTTSLTCSRLARFFLAIARCEVVSADKLSIVDAS